jgi:integrase
VTLAGIAAAFGGSSRETSSRRRNKELGEPDVLDRRVPVRLRALPRFRLYDLRHTFATHLLSQGAPITSREADDHAHVLCALVALGR